MITFSLGELKSIEESLRKLVAVQLPIVLSYKLSKVIKKINDALTSLEEHRLTLVQRYGDSQPDGSIKVPPDKVEEFMTEYNQLLGVEVEIDFSPIETAVLGSSSNINFTPIDMVALEKFFTD
jgi:hypothetical protein